MGASSPRFEAQAVAASALGLMPDGVVAALRVQHGFTGADANSLAIHSCRVISSYPRRTA